MEIYEIANQAIFDEPVSYKGIKIYPITIKYYQIVKSASQAFAVNIADETDLSLIGLPYMEYLMKKASGDPQFMQIWNIFNCVLELSLREQIFSFKYEKDFLKLIVAVPTEKYNEEAMCVYKEKLNLYNELTVDDFHKILNEIQISQIKAELDYMANDLFTIHTFDDNDFEEIKKIICYLNDIDDTIYDSKWEAELKKTSDIMAKLNRQNNPPEFEDLVDAVAFSLHKLPCEIMNMTVRRFDRYLDLEIEKENYRICKQAELSGTEFKTPLKHWLRAYKPKGRYSHAQNSGGGVQEVFKE